MLWIYYINLDSFKIFKSDKISTTSSVADTWPSLSPHDATTGLSSYASCATPFSPLAPHAYSNPSLASFCLRPPTHLSLHSHVSHQP